MIIKLKHLEKAKPEDVVRLAMYLKLETENKSVQEIVSAIWWKIDGRYSGSGYYL